MVYTTAALAQLKQFAAFGGGRGASTDPLAEQVAKDTTASIGPGVSYVSSELVTTPRMYLPPHGKEIAWHPDGRTLAVAYPQVVLL